MAEFGDGNDEVLRYAELKGVASMLFEVSLTNV
jgi:hypothetical protein